jgi:hypothetical protein
MLSFVWSKKQKYVRFITLRIWAEVAFWSSIRSAITRRGWARRKGGVEYVGKKLSWAASLDLAPGDSSARESGSTATTETVL